MSDLVAAGLGCLEARWGPAVTVERVEVDLGERAVFRARASDGTRVVVKVDSVGQRFRRERLALQAAAAGGVRVPRIVLARAGTPNVLVLEEVSGTPLSSRSPSTAWVRTGVQLRRLHGLPPPEGLDRFDHREGSWPEFMLWWADQTRSEAVAMGWLQGATAGIVHERMRARLERMGEPERRLLHGDCTPAHVLTDAGTDDVSALIDFGDAGTGDPAWDLVVLTLWCPERLVAVLEGYGPSRGMAEHVEVVGPAYRILRHLAAAGWLAEHGFDPAADLEMASRIS